MGPTEPTPPQPFPLQPFLSDETVVLRAPTQAWSAADGTIGARGIHGVYFSDVRIVSSLAVSYGGEPGEVVAAVPDGADSIDFVTLLRRLDDRSADPRIRAVHRRTVGTGGASETVTVSSTLAHPVMTTITVRLGADLANMDAVKSGLHTDAVTIAVADPAADAAAESTASWGRDAISVTLRATDARLTIVGDDLELAWDVTVPAKGSTSVGWDITATDSSAVVTSASRAPDWTVPTASSGDDRLDRWLARALVDLEALRMSPTAGDPASSGPAPVFLAAGAPWFFTLFGRDSIWSARLLLPLGGTLAADTLRVLASMQGTKHDAATAEQPGKIMHELRRQPQEIPAEGLLLPPLYYGTIDATPLWICLLHDAWKCGMPDAEIRALLPNLVAALGWMRDYGDADGDGLLEYVDSTGHGLANQGWKDSGDSVQWRDGRLAEGPIALCEVQAYAYEAAMHAADLLDHFGGDSDDSSSSSEWRSWAAALRARFHETFWISDAAGEYPAIALDAHKRPVDTVTSNIGHLLGTGILDDDQSARIASRLVSPELSSGYGLRTMSTDSAGYWPLSYHGGSVWAHDTAIVIRGLTAAGRDAEAAVLTDGLLAAAASFDYRMPELHSGDAATAFSRAVPYPAACRPQAWSAAAAVAVWAAGTSSAG
ncbi:MAG: amylo-alpha,6-glucosidase [Glaciihabitans sp.]|jgi:glycogen debranching enzyme|nr:amylo-alpha,6-glucosidase [Glaciihabitans sp.]